MERDNFEDEEVINENDLYDEEEDVIYVQIHVLAPNNDHNIGSNSKSSA